LAKANYALNHREIGLSSKYETQLTLPQAHFPALRLTRKDAARDEGAPTALDLAEQHGWLGRRMNTGINRCRACLYATSAHTWSTISSIGMQYNNKRWVPLEFPLRDYSNWV
jgi:hypothetical protein